MLMTKRRSKNDDVFEDARSRRQNLGKFIHSDPQNKKYSNKYRVTNANELKILLTKNKTHASNVPTITWQTSLRPNLGNNAAWDTKVKGNIIGRVEKPTIAKSQNRHGKRSSM